MGIETINSSVITLTDFEYLKSYYRSVKIKLKKVKN